MKRVFANIGFSVAVALVVLNFMNVKAALAALVASGVAFIVSVAVPKISFVCSVFVLHALCLLRFITAPICRKQSFSAKPPPLEHI